MVAPLLMALLPSLIQAGGSMMTQSAKNKADADMALKNSLLQQMQDSQKMFQSGLPSSPSGSSNNFLQRPLFGVGGQ